MANALNGIGSAPFAGLGTASYQVPAAGIYSMSFKSFIPYLPSGNLSPSSNPSRGSQNVATVADSSGSLNSKFFTFHDAGDAHGYYVWYNINSAGVDPAPAGLTGIEVSAATDVTADDLATATRSAINAVSGISVSASGATNNVLITNTYPGTTTAAADGNAATSFTFTVPDAGSWGTPPMSGLVVQLKQQSNVLAVYANPSPSQPLMSGKVIVNCSANDVLSYIFSSSSPADASTNVVKSILNVYLGE